MNISSILNGIPVGRDTSANFKPSVEGLAVRVLADGKFFCMSKDHKNLVDVTDLTFDGTDNYIYRLPIAQKDLKPGDLIITSENPFNALFVESVQKSGEIRGLDPATSQIIEYVAPRNRFINVHLYVKVVSLIDGIGDGAGIERALPFLLLGDPGANQNLNGALGTFLMIEALGGKAQENKFLPLFLLQGDKQDGMETILLMNAIKGNSNPFAGLLGTMSNLEDEEARVDPIKTASKPPSTSKTASKRRKR